jgi:hypothetical protein
LLELEFGQCLALVNPRNGRESLGNGSEDEFEFEDD